jgi:hypothetical protein
MIPKSSLAIRFFAIFLFLAAGAGGAVCAQVPSASQISPVPIAETPAPETPAPEIPASETPVAAAPSFEAPAAQADTSAKIAPGTWAGKLILQPVQTGQSGNYSFDFVIRILSAGRGMLVDIPEQGMFSYPVDRYSLNADSLSLVLDATGAEEELAFSGSYSGTFSPQGSAKKGGIVGTVRGRSWKGSFYVQKQEAQPKPGEMPFEVPVEGGLLPATITFPVHAAAELNHAAFASFPLVILVAGAGKTDRNGNNFEVPGKTDTLLQLAEGLRARNVGSFRYDRRGAAEAYMLEKPGHMTSFAQHVKDLVAVIRAAAALPREGRLILAGMNEGAWMALAALNQLGQDADLVDGLIMLDSSGQSPMEALAGSLEDQDEEIRNTAMEAAQTLIKTGALIPVPEILADFFSPSRKEWLASWLAFDPVKELKKVPVPVLLVYGENDMQVSREAFAKLADAKPSAAIKIVPGMNYVLKEVHGEDENYAAFTDPLFKVPGILVDLIAAFAKAQPAPQGLLPWSSH